MSRIQNKLAVHLLEKRSSLPTVGRNNAAGVSKPFPISMIEFAMLVGRCYHATVVSRNTSNVHTALLED